MAKKGDEIWFSDFSEWLMTRGKIVDIRSGAAPLGVKVPGENRVRWLEWTQVKLAEPSLW